MPSRFIEKHAIPPGPGRPAPGTRPLRHDITDFKWSTDPAGHPQCMAGLELRAFDLAKIGQMLVDGGMWHGTRVLSEAWIKRATQDEEPHSTFGLLWWRMTDGSRIGYDAEHIDAYRQAHVSKAVLEKLESMKGKLFPRSDFITVPAVNLPS